MNRLDFIFILLVFSACNRPDAPDCFKRAGEEGAEIRLVGNPVDVLYIEDLVEVRIIKDSTARIQVLGPVNLIPEVITEVSGNTLSIRNESRCNFVRDLGIRMQVEVYTPSLSRVYHFGQGDLLMVDTLVADYFLLEARDATGDIYLRLDADSADVLVHTGLCNLWLEGETRILSLFNQGFGQLDASQMPASVVLSNNSSINTTRLHVLDYLYAFIGNDGNTEYLGSPNTIELDDEGNGDLINAN